MEQTVKKWSILVDRLRRQIARELRTRDRIGECRQDQLKTLRQIYRLAWPKTATI